MLENFKKYNIIIKNTGYLSVLEILKLALPFIALPYIIRVVGVEQYGLIAFVQAIISYFSILINFGLDISAVKNVAVLRHERRKLSEFVSAVLCIKFLLLFLSFILLLISTFFVSTIKDNFLLVSFAFLSCFSDVLFPVWYYQGVEKMKYITLIRFFSILFYTVTIFIFIQSKDDYIYIPLLQSIGMVLSGVISIYILQKIDRIHFQRVSFSIMKVYFIESIPFFFSRLSLLINSGMAKIICGLFFSMQSVAAFDLAQKIATASFIPMQMVNQSIYPFLARTRDSIFARKCFLLMIGGSLCIVTIIYILAPFAVSFFAGDVLDEAVYILRLLSLFVFSGGLSLYLGTPLLVAFGYSKPFNNSVILSTFILLLLYLFLYVFDLFQVTNFALVLGFTELIIVFYRLFFCFRYKILSV